MLLLLLMLSVFGVSEGMWVMMIVAGGDGQNS